MSTIHRNLSEYDSSDLPSKERLANQHYAIVVADWNTEITHILLRGAIDTLIENGVREENITLKHVPGAFELIYASRLLQDEDHYAAIIALGCVVRGETPHFDYICQGVATGSVDSQCQWYVACDILDTYYRRYPTGSRQSRRQTRQ